MKAVKFLGKGLKMKNINEAKMRVFNPNEELICAIKGGIETEILDRKTVRKGILLITSQRVIFYMPKLFGRYEYEVYPYSQISSVHYHKGLAMDRIEITVASDYKVIKWIPKGDGEPATQIIQDMITSLRVKPSAVVHEPQKRFCSSCGASVPPEAKFCPYCGGKL